MKWISVEDRPPERPGEYEVQREDGTVMVAEYSVTYKTWSIFDQVPRGAYPFLEDVAWWREIGAACGGEIAGT